MAGGKSVEKVQDIALSHMDRINRQHAGERNTKTLTLQEQFEAERKWNKQSPEDKLKNLSWAEWQLAVIDYAANNRAVITQRCLNWVNGRFKAEYMKFHAVGTPLSEVLEWLQLRERALMNR